MCISCGHLCMLRISCTCLDGPQSHIAGRQGIRSRHKHERRPSAQVWPCWLQLLRQDLHLACHKLDLLLMSRLLISPLSSAIARLPKYVRCLQARDRFSMRAQAQAKRTNLALAAAAAEEERDEDCLSPSALLSPQGTFGGNKGVRHVGSADVLEGLASPQPNRPRYRKVQACSSNQHWVSRIERHVFLVVCGCTCL